MTQQVVNLLTDDLRPKRLPVSAQQSLYAWFALLAVLMTISAAQFVSMQNLRSESKIATGQLANVSQAIATLQKETALHEDAALAGKVVTLRADAQRQKELLAALEGGGVLQTEGFAGRLRELATYTVRDLWLTRMSFDARRRAVVLEGDTEDPVLVPRLLKKLAKGEHLKGQTFGAVELTRTDEGLVHFTISAPEEQSTDQQASAQKERP